MKKFLIFFIPFYICVPLFSSDRSNIYIADSLTDIETMNSTEFYELSKEKVINSNILINSYVTLDIDNEFKVSNEIKSLGLYKYEIDSKDLYNKVQQSQVDDGLYNLNKSAKSVSKIKSINNLKIVTFGNNNKKYITNGNFLVSLNKSIDSRKFAKDYELDIQQTFSNSILFSPSKSFNTDILMRKIALDDRVSNIELSIIDPYLKAR